MPGKYQPLPYRPGASRGTVLETIEKSILDNLGSAYDIETDSYVQGRAHAYARSLAEIDSYNKRLANQWQPRKLTTFLSRWENILGIVPGYSDTDLERRERVAVKLFAFGLPCNYSATYDLLVRILGDWEDPGGIFVRIIHTSSADANTSMPAATGSPGDFQIPGGALIVDDDFRSSVAYLAIEVTQPDGMTDSEFYALRAEAGRFLDDFLPAWVDWKIVCNQESLGGFKLDSPQNLDNHFFD